MQKCGGGARDEIARVYHIVRCNAIAPMGGGGGGGKYPGMNITSFPGSSLLWRKDAGWSWSRVKADFAWEIKNDIRVVWQGSAFVKL
jgi:hypothetical protein